METTIGQLLHGEPEEPKIHKLIFRLINHSLYVHLVLFHADVDKFANLF